MKIVGINYLSESSVCLMVNGKIISAISEERLNRLKNWYGLPFKSINLILKKNNLKVSDIDYFVTSGLSSITKDMPNLQVIESKIEKIHLSKLNKKIKNIQIKFLRNRAKHENHVINFRTKRLLNKLKKKYKKLIIYDHHLSHAASACYNSGFKKCLCLTIDGWGDNSSSKIYQFSNGKLKEISSTPTIDSLGYFYGSITKLLGFKPHQHEGKVLGLAAYGSSKIARKEISQMISYDKKLRKFQGNYENGLYQASFKNKNLEFLKKKYSKKNIAAAAQYTLEKVVLSCVKSLSKKKINLALAGGVFANVKLNQKINELKNIKNIFVFPNMGDGGLAVGGAQLCHFNKTNKMPKKIENMYLGNQFSEKNILKALKKYKVKYYKSRFIEKEIANFLAKGNVVAHFNGKIEFGPRALGNRSILCAADDPNINKSLNKKLKRTEFMPFAPIIMEKYVSKYLNINKEKDLYKFMTITCRCKSKMIKEAPAAVHIDNTARPQVVRLKDNLRIHRILQEYNFITRIPILINTSFNMHEEPIVYSPEDALRVYLDGKLDYLIINDFVIKK